MWSFSRLWMKTKHRLLYFKSFSQANVPGSDAHHRRKLWLLIIPVTTFGLGTWQVFRLQWKLNLIDELERKTTQPAVEIPQDVGERLEEMEYRRVHLTGSFDHTRELHIWPRTLNKKTTQFERAEPGTQIVTPFFCRELKQWLLINRGWTPKKKTDPATRQSGQVEGEVTLTAVVRKSEKRPAFSPKNDPNNNHWSHRDVEAMAAVAGTDPILLDADFTTTVPGGPIGGQTRVSLRNDHLQYLFTWYALSLATGYMFWMLWKKKGGGASTAQAGQKLYQHPPGRRK